MSAASSATRLVIDFAPVVSVQTLYLLAGISAALLLASFFLYRRGLVPRAVCAAIFILFLANPAFVHEDRKPASDTVVIAVDRSPSQKFGKREDRTQAALAYLQSELKKFENLDVRVVNSEESRTGPTRETRIFSAINETIADVPLPRRAGVVLLTDGQIHDIPPDAMRYADMGPVHALLSGEKKERDRRLVIIEAPAYGIVGQQATIKYRIEDSDKNAWPDEASIALRQDGDSNQERRDIATVGEDRSFTVTIGHAGQNVVDIETPTMDDEITPANNRVPVIINGVRDRLRVLLVSGQAYPGEKTWRDLLTSDAGVDLVHFTILREPDKIDMTPQRDLALIAFPFEELFEVKLYDFDLIIFDRYRLNHILPNFYFGNIARYVKEGGALLEASGPSFAGPESVYSTDLKSILPARPTGRVINGAFTPELTDKGHRHPVTQDLKWNASTSDASTASWGPWLRQVAVQTLSGDILMDGAQSLPLLILDRVGKGRVAQLSSDQIWLWSRGYKGGGPQAELLRRLAHWLMKEPELEESALEASITNGQLLIRRRSLSDMNLSITITTPDEKKSIATLEPGKDGFLETSIPAPQLGVYIVDDGTSRRFVLSGDINPPELSAVTTTASVIQPVLDATKGGAVWLAEDPQPAINILPPGRDYAGRNWIALRRSGASTITGVKLIPIMPSWAWALALLGVILSGWWLEGRTRKTV